MCDYSSAEEKEYIPIKFDDAVTLKECVHAAHCMIYAFCDRRVLDLYQSRAAVLMQLRFDGYMGFPGGLANQDEDMVSALNRELQEEINFDLAKHQVLQRHHVISHINHSEKLITHFYALNVSLEDFKTIEKRCLDAVDYGDEVFGIIRVNLYTMDDNYKGFPAFLNNNFIGNSKQQLLQALKDCHILTSKEIETAVHNSKCNRKQISSSEVEVEAIKSK